MKWFKASTLKNESCFNNSNKQNRKLIFFIDLQLLRIIPISRYFMEQSHHCKRIIKNIKYSVKVKRPRSPSPTRATMNAVNSAYFRPSPLTHPRIPAVSSVYGHPPVASGQSTYALSTSSGGVYPFSVSQVPIYFFYFFCFLVFTTTYF